MYQPIETDIISFMNSSLSFFNRILIPRLPKETPAWYRARLTMAVGGLTLAFYFFPEIISHLLVPLDPVSRTEMLIILSGAALTLGGFLAAKWGRLQPAVWLVLGGWTLDILLDIAFGEGMELGATMEVWLMFGLVMAFLLLDLRQYLVFAVLQTLSAWLVEWLRYRSGLDVSISVELHLAATALLGLGVWLRQRDQRQREEAAAALQQQKDYLQMVIDGVQSPFYVVDVKDYRIRLANRAARDLGLVTDKVTCYALTHRRAEPCGGDEHPCPLQHVRVERQPYTTEHIHFRPDGSTYYAEVRGYPLFDENGEVVQMVEYSADITERKRQEAEIRKLQQAVEHAASGVAITDPQGVFEYVNPTFERMTGYRREEVIGQTPRLLKSGKHPPEFYAQLWQTIQRGEIWQGELINRRKDGSLYWEFQTIAPVSANGKISHYVAVKLDVTAQKEMEEQLRQAKETAESASAFKSRLLANVSHDMRTPLGGIIGYAGMLSDGAFGAMSAKQQEVIQNISESAHRLNDLIRGMLTRAELESGKLRIQMHPFAPAALFKACTTHEGVAQRKGLTFQTEIDPSLPTTLYGDTYWLEQILVNLVDNAIKYTVSGGVWVRLRRVDASHWAIEVQDTGQGIAEELQERVFDAFEQAENTPGKRFHGVGLGLSIVKDLADRLGGEIRLKSAPGAGSTFTVIFPIEEVSNVA